MSRLTDMNDFRLIPQLVEEMTTRYDEEKEKYICKMLYDLKIDKDILKKQVQEIHRLNKVIAEYEQLEEQGLLLKLPCKVGDIVYAITRNFISEYSICCIEKYNDGFFFNWRCEKGIYKNLRGFTDYEIGKTVFLTKEEAEKALERLECAE